MTIYDGMGNILAEITDSGEIEALTKSLDFSQWTEATEETKYATEPSYYVDFHNGTAISLDGSIAYGQLGQSFTFTEHTIQCEGFIGLFHMNDAFFEQVKSIISEKHH